jgi:hypothetical protein
MKKYRYNSNHDIVDYSDELISLQIKLQNEFLLNKNNKIRDCNEYIREHTKNIKFDDENDEVFKFYENRDLTSL